MRNMVCIDTHILIWGIQGTSKKEQNDKIDRTMAFLDDLDKRRVRAVVPTIVLGEFLVGIPAAEHLYIHQLIAKRFMIIPYDLKAAQRFAQMWHARKEQMQELKALNLGTKQTLKADCMIAATAVSHNLDQIYTEDAGIRTFAQGFIPVSPLPPVPAVQQPLKPHS